MLGAPMAALAGIGVVELWKLLQRKTWLGFSILLFIAGANLILQMNIAKTFLSDITWQPWVLGLFILGAVAALIATLLKKPVLIKTGFSLIIAALLVSPFVWSALTMMYSSVNQSLPAAFNGTTRPLENRGGLQVNQSLLKYLQANTGGIEYLMAVPSSMQGADYVLATGRPVLYMGGFNGSDPVVNAEDLQYLVESGRLRFIYYTANGNNQNQNGIYNWLISNCSGVKGFNAQTANFGNPDGTGGAPGGMGPAGGPGMVGQGNLPINLYDCAR